MIQYLPNVSYLTSFDKFTLSVFAISVILLGVVSFMAIIDMSDDMCRTYDSYCLVIYCIVLTLVQIGFMFYGYRLRKAEMSHFQMGELDLHKLNYQVEKHEPINVVVKDHMDHS